MKSFLYAVVGFFAFYLAWLISYIVLGLIMELLFVLPIIKHLMTWLFNFRGDSPEMLVSIVSGFISFWASTMVLMKLCKNSGNYSKAAKILGTILIILNAFSLVINLISHSGIFINIVVIIAGFAMRYYGKDLQ